LVFSFSLLIFSLMGLPPLPGFWAKLILFSSLLENFHIIGLIFVALLSSAYYLRVLAFLYFTRSFFGLYTSYFIQKGLASRISDYVISSFSFFF